LLVILGYTGMFVCMFKDVYVCLYRERERERERDSPIHTQGRSTLLTHIEMECQREREEGREGGRGEREKRER
jgi:hypothetical protein